MFKLTAYAFATGIAAIAATLALPAAPSEAATRTIFACRAFGSPDISMAARYEVRSSTRKKFTAEFESAPDPRFAPGSRLAVSVAGVRVGSAVLDPLTGGGVVADLNFDTQRQVDALPFPANWPATVGAGTAVNFFKGTTLVLGCSMTRR